MASNVSQNIVPSFWSSANDDVLFEFSFNPYSIDSITNDVGLTKINLQYDFDVTPVIGEYIYINSNVYVGTYKILSVTGTSSVTIDLVYISSVTSNVYNCYHLRVPTFSFYKGFDILEDFPVELPYTKVIDIKPSVLYNSTTGIPYLSINLKGSVKYIFNILPNTVANSTDFSMFNAIRLTWDSNSTISGEAFDYNLILNSSITNDELIQNFTVQGKYLLPINKPLIPTSGIAFCTTFIFGSKFPTIHKFINGVKQ
jgi:hypothetical protein